MNVWWQLAVGITVLWLVLRFALSRFNSREPSESVEGPLDPSAGVPSPKRCGPRNRSGAIALAEPDEEDWDNSFPPRSL
jgi:hypothetical protein